VKVIQKNLSRRRQFVVLGLTISAVLTSLLLKVYVSVATKGDRYTDTASVPFKPVAVVFGAGVYSDGTPSPMLADRINGAVDLYRQKKIRKLLMTGDNSTQDYDEVSTMKRYAMAQGIPEKDITLDYAGFSSYESCYRAKAIFGVTQAVLVTQRYHLPRAVYTCQQLGINAVGLGTPDWETYGASIMVPYTLREVLSTLKAVWQVKITHPQPTFLGPFEGMR
jgi:vancomycin permeability regulator SanA